MIFNRLRSNQILLSFPQLLPSKTSSKLATAQGSNLTNFGKLQLLLVLTGAMEQNKLLTKLFKKNSISQIKKPNILGIPFFINHITTIIILNSKIHKNDKYARMKNTSITFFQRLNKQPPFFSKIFPTYNQEEKHLKPQAGDVYNFSISQVH